MDAPRLATANVNDSPLLRGATQLVALLVAGQTCVAALHKMCSNKEGTTFTERAPIASQHTQAQTPALAAARAGARAHDVYMGIDCFGRGSFGGGGLACHVAARAAREAGQPFIMHSHHGLLADWVCLCLLPICGQ